MQRTLLAFNLLKDKPICPRIEARQAGASPLLISFRIVLPQARHILRHLLQDLRLEVRGLARAHLPLGSILRALEACSWGGELLELAFLGGVWRGGDVTASIG